MPAQLNMKIPTKTKQEIAKHVRVQAVVRGEKVSTTQWILEAAAEKMEREQRTCAECTRYPECANCVNGSRWQGK